jgi:formylmethanofuran--tetrahydromethanopterin N-formyltransferase
MIDKTRISSTYAEAFQGICARVIVTADDDSTLKKAAEDSTSTPSVVIGRIEGGIEKWISNSDTPDHREGAILQFWGAIQSGKSLQYSLQRFEKELSYKIRQDILVKPFTAVFNALNNTEGKMDMMERIGHCGDGFEWIENRYGRELIIVPLMVPDFIIERYLGYSQGIMGANFWIMCETKTAVHKINTVVLKAINEIEGVITPFDLCSAGSKPETNFPLIGPTTNHPYCSSLKKRIGSNSRVPKNVKYIPEIVINGLSLEAVKKAMRVGIQSALSIDGVKGISAGNYGGSLGKYKINLLELFV